ncbi:uncharacterized protein N7458_000861 [Penicillium daleae]|uniref:Rhodopsin domain-containing protein n=1 Tax=Penicillium daleae TaxID=63821 RepID=A0AAD6G883_9EURO|nr:uncharacterized protein N7458_000861 [Penicillium daleae]KAJ5465175.1 hypothetical protein N7458_000861 [Penicillium daleae]
MCLAAQSWAKQCDLPHNNHKDNIRAAIAASGIGILIVILRIISRAYTLRKFWWDDWSHIIAGVLMIPLLVFGNLSVNEGMGYHLYDINFSSISQATHLALWYYLSQIFWLVVIYFIKMSILFLYLRIFPEIPLFRRCVMGTMVFTTVAVLILVPMAIWQCVPIHAIWDLKREDARCLSISGVAYASAGVNIATELAVLILPLPLLRRLRATVAQKVALYALFGCGILVIAIASARVPTLRNVEAIRDPTYSNSGVFYWTCAETVVAHLCAAAPAIRPLYVKLRDIIRRKRQKTSDSSESNVLSGGSLSNPRNRSIHGLSSQQVASRIPERLDDRHNLELALHDPSLSLEKSDSRRFDVAV